MCIVTKDFGMLVGSEEMPYISNGKSRSVLGFSKSDYGYVYTRFRLLSWTLQNAADR